MGLAARGATRTQEGVLINETLARRLWPDSESLGRPIWVLLDRWEPLHVAGVVPDIPQSASNLEAQPEVLLSLKRASYRGAPDPRRVTLLVRPTDADRRTATSVELQRVLRREPGAAIEAVHDFEAARERAQRRPRAAIALAGLGSIFALALAGSAAPRRP
jgi:hypothetical protein